MRTHLSLVNQKLGFASEIMLLGGHLPATSKQNFQRQACGEAVLLHLYSAFHFYLREIAENNHVKNPGAIDSLLSLSSALGQIDRHPSEVVELQELAGRTGSWLNDFLSQYEEVFKSPAKQVEKKAFLVEGLIETVDVDLHSERSMAALDFDQLSKFLSKFKVLIQRQRETGAEY